MAMIHTQVQMMPPAQPKLNNSKSKSNVPYIVGIVMVILVAVVLLILAFYVRVKVNKRCDCPFGDVCRTGTSVCVNCNSTSDCTGKDEVCFQNTCRQACKTSYDCPSDYSLCYRGACIECATDSDCVSGSTLKCLNGECVQCIGDSDCGASEYCDPNNTCKETCYGSSCTDPSQVCWNSHSPPICVECIPGIDNTAISGCSADTPICNQQTYTCVQCTSNEDCIKQNNPDGSICDTIRGVCTSNLCPLPGSKLDAPFLIRSSSNPANSLCIAAEDRQVPGTTTINRYPVWAECNMTDYRQWWIFNIDSDYSILRHVISNTGTNPDLPSFGQEYWEGMPDTVGSTVQMAVTAVSAEADITIGAAGSTGFTISAISKNSAGARLYATPNGKPVVGQTLIWDSTPGTNAYVAQYISNGTGIKSGCTV